MKKTRIFTAFLFICLCLSSCASKKELQEKPELERTEDYIADLTPIFLGNLHLYTKQSVNAPKITDFDVYFNPRTNTISLSFKLGLNVVQLSYSYSERKEIYDSAKQYIFNYENNLITVVKPTSKNAYLKGKAPISWGVFGLVYSTITKYQANTEYLWIDKPYYRLKYDTAKANDDDANSPSFSIYISPSQWQNIFEMCNQAVLESKVDDILEQADVF